jgi:hypothetical protein
MLQKHAETILATCALNDYLPWAGIIVGGLLALWGIFTVLSLVALWRTGDVTVIKANGKRRFLFRPLKVTKTGETYSLISAPEETAQLKAEVARLQEALTTIRQEALDAIQEAHATALQTAESTIQQGHDMMDQALAMMDDSNARIDESARQMQVMAEACPLCKLRYEIMTGQAVLQPGPEASAPPHGIGAYTGREIMESLGPAIELKDARTANEIMGEMRQWTLGYLVALEITRNIHVLDGADQESLDRMLLEGCEEHPDLKLGQVVTAWMTRQAVERAKRAEPPPPSEG